jgi:hypothetical protein
LSFENSDSAQIQQNLKTGRRDNLDHVLPPGYSAPFFMDEFGSNAKEKIEVCILDSVGRVTSETVISLKKLKNYKPMKDGSSVVHLTVCSLILINVIEFLILMFLSFSFSFIIFFYTLLCYHFLSCKLFDIDYFSH